MITEVANFKEKGLVNKVFLKTNLSMQGIELRSPVRKKREVTTMLTIHWTLVQDRINLNIFCHKIKASISLAHQYPRLRRSILGTFKLF